VPRTLAESAGMDTIDALVSLRRSTNEGWLDVRNDVYDAKIADMKGKGVFEAS